MSFEDDLARAISCRSGLAVRLKDVELAQQAIQRISSAKTAEEAIYDCFLARKHLRKVIDDLSMMNYLLRNPG